MEHIIEKVRVSTPIDWSPHHHAFVNPYNGCTSGCPYCFWLDNPEWEGRIQIRENIPELLEAALTEWPKDEFIYLGSVCDPFMEVERSCGLTGECLGIIKKHGVPLLITSSCLNDIIRKYEPLLKSFEQRVILVIELSRLQELERLNKDGLHTGIENANYLASKGLEIWTTISPVLPGITDISKIRSMLAPSIPIYLDSLRCSPGSIQSRRVMEWIENNHPELAELYRPIALQGDTSYFEQIITGLEGMPGIKYFPYDLS